MISAAYIATYLCGISMEHLSPSRSSNVPNLITTIMRYHLHYTIRKFMANPRLLDKYDIEVVKNNIPVKTKLMTSVGKHHGYTYPFDGFVEYSDRDYFFFIAPWSDGVTSLGQGLLQESIESFTYSVLVAQSITRWVIVGEGAKSTQSQDDRKYVEKTVGRLDTVTLISDMRSAITDTNVVLNMAISPGIILAPSDMKILERMIPGYNNTLTQTKDSMGFGVNTNLNYHGAASSREAKKNHQSDQPSSHVETLPPKGGPPKGEPAKAEPELPPRGLLSPRSEPQRGPAGRRGL